MNEFVVFFGSLIMNMIGLYFSIMLWNYIWVKGGYECFVPRD